MTASRPARRVPDLSRRSLFSGGARLIGGAALLGGVPAFLAGCGSDDAESSGTSAGTSGSAATNASTAASGSSAPAAMKDLGSIDFQLSWVKDYEFAGSYIADTKGYWKDQGLGVNLVAGGGSAAPHQILASGQAFVASSSVIDAANLRQSDDIRIKIVGCVWQKYGLTVVSRADNPITTPQDLVGKTIGVFPANESDWNPFLQLNDIDPKSFNEVPSNYDITPLVNGEIDGFQGYGSSRAAVLGLKGIDLVTMRLADFSYNPISAAYAVMEDTLDDPEKRAQLIAFLRGEIMGWQEICFDGAVDEGATLTVEKYGADLGESFESQQVALAGQAEEFMVTPNTTENGLFLMSEEMISGTQKILEMAEVDVDVNDIVTNELLEEIYDGKNRL